MSVTTFKFKGMNNVSDPADVAAPDKSERTRVFTEGVKLQNVDPDNKGGFATRLGYTELLSGNYRAAYSDGKKCFVVKDNGIYSFNGTGITLITTLSTATTPVAFAAVNDVVVYSNGSDFGVIEDGQAFSATAPTEPFMHKMIAGTVMAYMNPYLLVGVGNILYRSEPFMCDQMDERHNIMEVLPDALNMVLPVDDGCYIITEGGTWWRGGTTDADTSLRLLAGYGGVFGTGITTTAEKLKATKAVSGTVVVWLSTQGICTGANGGHFINHSDETVAVAVGASGAAVLREHDGLIHYVVSTDNSNAAFNPHVQPTLDIIDLS